MLDGVHLRPVLRRRASNGDTRCWKFAQPSERHLCDARKKLDKWWDLESLTYNKRKYLIHHRWDDEPPAHEVMVESVILRAYLQMKAR